MATFVEDTNNEGENFGHIDVEAHPDCVAFIRKQLCRVLCLNPDFADDDRIFQNSHLSQIAEFLLGDESRQTMFAYVTITELSEAELEKLAEENPNFDERDAHFKTELFITVGAPPKEKERQAKPGLKKDLAYFLKTDPKGDVSPDNIERALIIGSVKNGAPMPAFLRSMQSAFAPSLLSNRTWPDSIQKELGEVLHQSMASLTEHVNRMQGRTVLYVPIVNLTAEQWSNAHNDKELVQTFQTAMLHWKRQIREVVNEKDVDAGDSAAGPLDEIEYWRARASDLSNIRQQFTRPDVLRIVDVMNRTKEEERAFYLQPFLDLSTDNENSTNEAIDNLRYLNTLEEPCINLANATPREIPGMLRDLLRTVHMFLMHSRHYKRDRFFRLLRMISNEIVNRCRKQINLQAIFDGDVEDSMVALEESIEAGKAWVSACTKMLVATRERYRRERGEQFEIVDIFSEINSFVKHRCMNLQEVCIGQLQFGFKRQPARIPGETGLDDLQGQRSLSGAANNSYQSFSNNSPARGEKQTPASLLELYAGVLPCFGGAKGPEIESQLLDIQRAFKLKMEGLRQLKYDILDIKARDWSDDFHQFKNELDDLTLMMVQIISGAFQLVATVEGGAELLEAFHYLAKRDELHRNVEKKKEPVFALFNAELNFVQKELVKASPVMWLHPPHAGRAAWVRNFRLRIEHNYRLLSRLWYLQPEKAEPMILYRQLEKGTLDEIVRKEYNSWKDEVPPVPSAYLDEFLIIRRQLANGLEGYSVNFPVELSILIEESRYWLRSGETVPQSVIEILQREERLRVYRENVAIAVRAYNNIVLSLPSARELFSVRIAFLESKFAAGLNKSTWSSQGIVEYFVRECRIQTEKVQTGVDRFKHAVRKIDHICDHISTETLAIGIEKKREYRLQEFVDRQRKYQELVRQKLIQAHQDITEIMKGQFDYFRNDYKDNENIRVAWHKFVAEIDGRIAYALKHMVKRSMNELLKALVARDDPDKASETALFKIDVIIPAGADSTGAHRPTSESVKPSAEPSMQTLNETLINICNEAMDVVTVLPLLERSLTEVIDVENQKILAEGGVATTTTSSSSHHHGRGNEQKLQYVEYIHPAAAQLAAQQQEDGVVGAGATINGAPAGVAGANQQQGTLNATAGAGVTGAGQGINNNAAVIPGSHESYSDYLHDDGRVRDEPAAGAPHESEMILLLKQIQHTINEVEKSVKMQLALRMDNLKAEENVSLGMWKSKEDALRRARNQWQLGDYIANIRGYKNTELKIAASMNQYSHSFISLEYSPMKAVLRQRCTFWIDAFLGLLHDQSVEELDKIYNFFEENLEKLRRPPQNIAHAHEQQELEKRVRIELEEKRAEHVRKDKDTPSILHQKFQTLEEHSYSGLKDEDKKRKQDLPQEFEAFALKLNDCRKKVEKNMESFKQDLESDIRSFGVACEHLKKDLLENGPYGGDMKTSEAFKKIAEYSAKVQARREKESQLKDDMGILRMERPEQQDLKEIEHELQLLTRIWELTDRWQRETETWKRCPFKQLSISEMNEVVAARRKETMSLRKELERREVWTKLLSDITLFGKCLPVVEDLLSPALRDRHWRQLMVQLDETFDPDSPEFCLDTLLALRIERNGEFVSNLASAAKQELNIEKELEKIKAFWEATEIAIEEYHGASKLASVDLIQQQLTEDITKLGGFKMSQFVEAFKYTVQTWEQTLSSVGDALDTILLVQQKWMYLENIFIGGEDIKRKLVEEAKLFDQVNTQWASIMARLAHDPSILKIARPEVVDISTLLTMNGNLEKIQKSLESFLDDKRRNFPRFYFLSNDDLLDILGNSKEPKLVQPHLRKCFEGIHKLDLDKSRGVDIVRAMISSEQERVAFPGPIQIGGLAVEQWLTSVETKMKETIKRSVIATLDHLQREVYTFKKPIKRELLTNWLSHEGQSLITAAQINWTKESERVLEEYAKIGGPGANPRRKQNPGYKLYKKWKILIKRYCELVRQKMPRLLRNKLVALITIEVHSRDVSNMLQARRASSVLDFDWIRQLRFYREPVDDSVTVKQTSATVYYDWEYLGGSNGRLVVTPLTDRAYMTLTTALQLHLGGLPQGPAGTGKTETVKDLGKGIGKYVLVFNCSDDLDYKSLGRMFSGLAQTGTWSCFDEFNRIEPEVLSVVAQQIFQVLTAVKERKKQFIFEGVEMKLNLNVGIFVTMNPGYAGRSELPDNLKALLRPVSMMAPAMAMICEITLLSQGFTESHDLAKKVAILYQLMESQLSKQDHYDFSLRNIKAVLVQAGNLKRENFPGTEKQLCLKACSDMNMPKFVKDDVPLFQGMLSDLFPKVVPESAGLEELKEACIEEMDGRALMRSEHISVKTLHFWDTLNTRHGLMLVGAAASGKTTTWQVLSGALKRLKDKNIGDYNPVKVHLINPKAVTMQELYGNYNLATREWTDGILSDIMRVICRDETPLLKWVLFDGPVDTLWIESMNTVLDDNKMLTLNSGERISLTPQINMVFECESLSTASPATVSRCGMVYFNASDLGWQPYIHCWLKNRMSYEVAINAPKPETTISALQEFINEHLAKVLEFRNRECTELFPTSDFNAVQSFTRLFDAIASPDAAPFLPQCPKLQPQSAGENYAGQIQMLAVFSLIWAFGGTLTEDSRRKFDTILRDVENSIPSNDTSFEYFPDFRSNSFRQWDDHPALNKQYEGNGLPPDETPFYRLLVPTQDTIRHSYIVSQLVRSRCHTVLVGETGTGKSLIASTVLRDLPQETHVTCQINFSAQTTSKNVQDIIEGRMDRKSNKVYAPPGGRRMVCFIEDLNMPAKEKFGAQGCLELLRMWIDNGFWFDRKTQVKRQINDMQILSCMTAGRPAISMRMLSKLFVLNINFPSDQVVTKIFTSIMMYRLANHEDLLPHCDLIVKATIQVYQKVTQDLLPIPSKSHYLFNLRDLSKVFQGMYSAYWPAITDKDHLVCLWMHECFRVFADRMNDLNDKAWFRSLIVDKLATLFSLKWNTLLKDGRNPIFVDFWEGELDEFAKYKLTPSQHELKAKLEESLENFNNEPGARAMNLVFFDDAVEHLCRIHRIIRTPRGNALLVGLGGSGRSSLTRLACYLAGYSMFTIEVHKKYDQERFHDDLRTLYRSAGGTKSQQRVFYISDNQITQNSFLEDINNILSVGEVPNLFPKEDVKNICDEMRKLAMEEGYRDTADEVFAFFNDRARRNIHLCLALSPAHKLFRLRLRQFPSFISCTTIDWFVDWPAEALKEVSSRLLVDTDLGDDEIREKISSTLVFVHELTGKANERLRTTLKRFNYITPTSYLEMVRGYTTMIENKRYEISLQRDKLQNGMAKLEETKASVAKMKADLTIQEEALRQKTAEVDRAMRDIHHQQQIADEQQSNMTTEKAKIERDKQAAEIIKTEAQAELDKAMPALNEATQALDALRKEDITEVKTFSKPPELVRLVMQAVQTLLGRGIEWDDAKKTLNEQNFLESLKEYPVNSIPEKMVAKIEKFVKMQQFDVDLVRKTNIAASGLCKWVIAVHRYAIVYKEVAPKMKKLEDAVNRVAHQEEQLRIKEAKLAEILARVKKLQEDLQALLDEKKRLQDAANETAAKLERANIIVSGLEGERDRWTKAIENFDIAIGNLVGDALIACGVLSYCGAFPSDFRDDLVEKWSREVRKQAIPMSRDFDFCNFLTDPTEVRDWLMMGLPGDDFSKENGCIVTRGSRWTLCVDPQGQAKRWLKKMEADNGLKVVDPKQSDFMKSIEYAIQFGVPVLLQDVLEDLDPSLDSVISKAIIRKGGRSMIKVGDNFIDYNDNFRLYITTKLANPHYTPEICTKVSLLNFAVKEAGLEEQLLKIVVEKEKPDLEIENERLIQRTAAAKKKTKQLQDEILDLLNNSKVSLLENLKLIETLQTSKQTEIEITAQLKEAEILSEKNTQSREQYRECARRASTLFFVLADLGSIDTMYQFSLDAYIILFQNSIKSSALHIKNIDTVAERVTVLNDWHTGSVYKNTCRGLFENHKLLFSFHMTIRILAAKNDVNLDEYAFFLKGGMVLDREAQSPNPAPAWLSEKMWDHITELEKLVNFHGIVASFEQLHKDWHAFFLEEKPEESTLPAEWENRVGGNYLQRMVIVRCLRPDRLLFMVTTFIENTLSRKFVDPPAFNLRETLDESKNILPLVFILSPGVDPTTQLKALAEQKNQVLKTLALGQGQDKAATKLILEGAQSGNFCFLANCHLMISWLPELEKIIEGLPNLRPHDNFRLWLSSVPHPAFPIGILQRAIKMTTEPPKGLKSNMVRLMNAVSEEQFVQLSGDKPHFYRPLFFALCYFHSVLLERKKFGTLGYNVIYDFNFSDFEVSNSILSLYINGVEDPDADPKDLPFVTIRYLIAEASYGGRVTDDWDRRLINTYIESFVRPDTIGDLDKEGAPPFRLSAAPEYFVPPDAPPLKIYREFCNSLPLVDPPEAFGQHANADIASQIAGSTAILDNLMAVNATLVKGGGGGSGGGSSSGGPAPTLEEKCLSILDNLDEQIPQLIDFDLILESTQDDRGSALNTCLLQEIQRYNILLAKIRRQKKELRRAVKGEIVMNDELDVIFNAVLIGKVPQPWQSGYPSVKPLSSWARDLIERVDQLLVWGRSQPKVFWLGGFTYPSGFLKSLQQQVARRDSISIDQYGWEFFVLPGDSSTVIASPKEGAYVKGIYLEGAGWNSEDNCLCEPRPMELVVPMPIIHFKPKRREVSKTVVSGIYCCPLYMYPIRTGTRERPSYVLGVDLASGESDPEHWTKRGTALMLSTAE